MSYEPRLLVWTPKAGTIYDYYTTTFLWANDYRGTLGRPMRFINQTYYHGDVVGASSDALMILHITSRLRRRFQFCTVEGKFTIYNIFVCYI